MNILLRHLVLGVMSGICGFVAAALAQAPQLPPIF